MKTEYLSPRLQEIRLIPESLIANSITSATVDGEDLNIDNSTVGDASSALIKGQGSNNSFWDDDWSQY